MPFRPLAGLDRFSLPARFTFYVVAGTAILWLLLLSSVFYVSKNILTQRIKETETMAVTATAKELDSYFARILSVADTLAAIESTVADRPNHLQQLDELLKSILRRNPQVYDIYVAFEKGVIPGQDYFIPAFRRNADGEIVFDPTNVPGQPTFNPALPTYEYHKDERWYLLAKRAGKAVWGPAYLDLGATNKLVVSAVSPIFGRDGAFIGVAGCDVTLEQLAEVVEKNLLPGAGYTFAVESNGTILTFPEKGWILDRNLTQLAEEKDVPKLKQVADSISRGKGGLVSVRDPLSGKDSWAAYAIVPGTRWGIIGVLPKDELLKDVDRLLELFILFALLGIAVLGGVTWRTTRRMSKRLNELSTLAEEMALGNTGAAATAIDLITKPASGSEMDKFTTAFREMSAYLLAMERQKRLTETEEQLAESESRYRITAEQTGQVLYDWNLRTNKMRWFGAIPNMTGFSIDEYQEVDIDKWAEMIHPEDRKEALKQLDDARGEGNYIAEYRMVKKDGSYMTVEDHGVFLRDAKGGAYRMLGTMRDITERKRIDEDKHSFYKETIKSVTQNKLQLASRNEIKPYLAEAQEHFTVNTPGAAANIRSDIRAYCISQGLEGDRLDLFLTGAGEAINNAIKHAGGGEVYVGSNECEIWVAVVDPGPGIEKLILPSATLKRGFSTKTSMGLGYSIMLEVADCLILCTGPHGTVVVLKIGITGMDSAAAIEDLPDTWNAQA